ncbi:hypothetical protein NPIL_554001 [Nephila pilipes]|uniref:Uncharacterized protein n=1 Tax=Nephila pilipes TaxID=299642 RepID=A0A8X6PC78_NEPPI|nr:hypothetical protein NPIL_554001 [Nephila pilipes]
MQGAGRKPPLSSSDRPGQTTGVYSNSPDRLRGAGPLIYTYYYFPVYENSQKPSPFLKCFVAPAGIFLPIVKSVIERKELTICEIYSVIIVYFDLVDSNLNGSKEGYGLCSHSVHNMRYYFSRLNILGHNVNTTILGKGWIPDNE